MIRSAIVLPLLALVACGPAKAPEKAEFAFANQSIVLPDEPAAPALPEIVQANCTACHSAEMIATQPPLAADKWAGEVKKMREVYKAGIAPADDAAIVAALTTMQAHGSAR